ncbi:MAG: hypothetical protein U1F76_16565 [Candidatus Competibacteraceae bacterium]
MSSFESAWEGCWTVSSARGKGKPDTGCDSGRVPHTPATAVSAAAIARAVQSSPSYFSPALSRWNALWSGSFYDFIAVIERFRSIPSLAALDISIARQLNLEPTEPVGTLKADKVMPL